MSADVADSPTAPGGVIAGHRIVGTLERGPAGSAFRAVAPDGTAVVLRVVKPSGGRAAVARFEQRAALLDGLSHPALARVTGFGETAEGLWLATAEVEGATLRSLIDQGLTPMRAVRLLGDVADGMDAAHSARVIHGDVRAENVIVQGRPVERALLVGFPLDAEGADRAGDIEGLSGVMRECVPDADPGQGHASAGELIGAAAQSLLASPPRPRPGDQAAVAPAALPAEVRPRRGAPALRALAALLIVAGAAGAGYAVSEQADSEPTPPAKEVTAGALGLSVPAGWERGGGDGGLPELKGGLVLRRDSPRGSITAGVARGSAAILDPSTVAAGVAGGSLRPREVRLGGLTALRFDGLEGDGPSVLYVASTSKGAPTVACTGPAVAEPCADAARGLTLRGARAYDPAAGVEWRNDLARQMRRLRARRARGLRTLRAAATPGGQARAADRIARLHARTARAVRRGDAPPQAAGTRRRVLSRLLAVDRAYRALARSARRGDEAAFNRSLRRIRRADRRLQVTLRSI